jgi:DNA-binding transcriptional MerR regulator
MAFIVAPAAGRGISSSDIYDTLGISQQLLSLWVKKSIVKPSVRRGRRGDPSKCGSLWSFYDLLDMKTIIGLRRAGLSMHKVRKVVAWLRQNGYALHSSNLATDGDKVWINLDDVTVEIIKATNQIVLLDWKIIVKQSIDMLEKNGIDV